MQEEMLEKPQESNSMSKVFERLSDLKSIFKFGEKIVPIIQSLVEFMREIIPLLETINSSISDSTKKMPMAANQIADVTSATELATTQILDLVDDIGIALNNIESGLIQDEENRAKVAHLLAVIKEKVGPVHAAQAELDEVYDLVISSQLKESSIQLIEAIKDDTYKITLSLQVQDITAQQLAAVNHLIESVNNRLTMLVQDINQSDIRSEFLPEDFSGGGIHFDPNASYTKTEGKQDVADAIVQESRRVNN
ncbi:MAG: hypothetical protein HYV28_17955 [Ignavibacteriales bacterium]|nr:hypothetical protein [Ignavibacteriales bacterium]